MDAQDPTLTLLLDTISRVDDNRRGHVVAELATITLMIDAGIVTIPQVCERLELIQSGLGERYQTDETKRRIEFLTLWLREREPRDGPRWTPEVIEGGKGLN